VLELGDGADVVDAGLLRGLSRSSRYVVCRGASSSIEAPSDEVGPGITVMGAP
jgi:hypothetical protein